MKHSVVVNRILGSLIIWARNSSLGIALILTTVSLPKLAKANKSQSCIESFKSTSKANELGVWEHAETTISWSVSESRRDSWGREYKHRFYYADAGISPAGILYFNLRTISEAGVRTKVLGGREFVDKAVDYFKQKGRTITGVKGWWVFRDDEGSDETLGQQVEDNPLSSINFTEYFRNRKSPNDKEAARKTWTAKIAASLGFSEIASISEQFQRNGYKAVYVTFISKTPPIHRLRKELENENGEIYIDLESAMKQTGMGDEPARIHLFALTQLVVPNSAFSQILRDNSLIASDFAALGFELESIERKRVEGKDGSDPRSALILKLK